MNRKTWSEAEVKAVLPNVRVRWNNKLYWGKVTGRLNRFASVSPYQVIDSSPLVKTIMGPIVQFSWHAVTRAVNENKVLIVE